MLFISECFWRGRLDAQQSVWIWLLPIWIYKVSNRCDDTLAWQFAEHFGLTKFRVFQKRKKRLRFWSISSDQEVVVVSLQDKNLTDLKSHLPKVLPSVLAHLCSLLFHPFLVYEDLLLITCIIAGKSIFFFGLLILIVISYLPSGLHLLRFCSSVLLLLKTRSSGSQNPQGSLNQKSLLRYSEDSHCSSHLHIGNKELLQDSSFL